MTPEFSRPIRIDTLGSGARSVEILAEPSEREALARRFGLVSIGLLEADSELTLRGETVTAAGTLRAEVVQSCVATDLPVPARIEEAFQIQFRPTPSDATEEEVELGEADLDVVFYEDAAIDLGEAVAETLALSLDPYPRAAEADAMLREAGVKSEGEAGAFGALAGLKDKLEKR